MLILCYLCSECLFYFFFQAEDGIRDVAVTGVQTCALPISRRADFLEAEEDRFPPHVRRARDHVAPFQLRVPAAGLHFPHRAHGERTLDGGAQMAPQQLHRLRPLHGGGRIGAGDLEHDASTLADNGLRVVAEPRLTRALGRLGERALRRGPRPRPAGEGDARKQRDLPEPSCHTLSTKRWYTPAGSAARVMGRPTTRWVAPRRTASTAEMVRA